MRLEVPPARGVERHPLELALDDEARRDRLHAARREPARDLLPEDGRHLVAVEAVEDAARLLRVDEALVDLARLAECAIDRVLRDLVEDHAANRHGRLQHLEQMPGDRFALAVFVCCEQELVRVLQELLQLADPFLLVRVDDVERPELVLDVHAEPRPLLLLVFLRDVGGALGQVTDVADARLDDEIVSEVALDRPRLGRRLDDHQALVLSVRWHRRVTIARPHEVEYSGHAADTPLQPDRDPLGTCSLRALPAAGARAGKPAGRRLRPRLATTSRASIPGCSGCRSGPGASSASWRNPSSTGGR